MVSTKPVILKVNFDSCAGKCEKSAVKDSTEKPNLLYSVNFSTIVSPRLQINFYMYEIN